MSVKVGNVMRGLLVFVSNTQEHGKTVEGRKIEQNLMRFSYTHYTLCSSRVYDEESVNFPGARI